MTTMKEIEAINIRRVQEQLKRRPPIMLDRCEEELARIKLLDRAKQRAEEQAAKRVAAQRAEKQARQRRAGLAYRESCKVSYLTEFPDQTWPGNRTRQFRRCAF